MKAGVFGFHFQIIIHRSGKSRQDSRYSTFLIKALLAENGEHKLWRNRSMCNFLMQPGTHAKGMMLSGWDGCSITTNKQDKPSKGIKSISSRQFPVSQMALSCVRLTVKLTRADLNIIPIALKLLKEKIECILQFTGKRMDFLRKGD